MYKNFFFDFDGTIFDSYEHSTTALINVIRKTRNVELDFDEVFSHLRISFGNCFDFYNLDDNERRLVDIEHHKIDLEPLVHPYEYTKELLEYLYSKNFNIFIYTNRDDQTIEYLKMFDLLKYFKDFIMAPNFPYKPNPESLNYMASKYNLNKKECLVIGDRKLDIEGGINANMDGLLIDEFGKIDNSNATFKVSSIKEALDLIKDMNGD